MINPQETDIIKALNERGYFFTHKDNGDTVSMGFPFKMHDDNEKHGFIINNAKDTIYNPSDVFDFATIFDMVFTDYFKGYGSIMLSKQKHIAAFGEFTSFDELNPNKVAKNIIVEHYSRKSIFEIFKNWIK